MNFLSIFLCTTLSLSNCGLQKLTKAACFLPNFLIITFNNKRWSIRRMFNTKWKLWSSATRTIALKIILIWSWLVSLCFDPIAPWRHWVGRRTSIDCTIFWGAICCWSWWLGLTSQYACFKPSTKIILRIYWGTNGNK